MDFTLTREQLLHDLYLAYYDARKHKTTKKCVIDFENNLKENIEKLCDDLYNRNYRPLPSKCFIVNYPKKREIFAAQFSDRIVHHLYFNYTSQIFERTFIQDTYSCIKGRGTHYGIKRLENHIRKESQNYKQKCYVMKLDIRGYFMNINRQILNKIACDTIKKMGEHRVSRDKNILWKNILDIEFLLWLSKTIIMLDPTIECEFACSKKEWRGLDKNKSLFWTDKLCGLPIGNLTSQLFSNVYLNMFDQFIKRILGFKHYGRYVDDAYIVCVDKKWMLLAIPKIREFLKNHLLLQLHMGKLKITEIHQGVEFLGGFLKPYRNYISRRTLERVKSQLSKKCWQSQEDMMNTINPYLGMMVHFHSFYLRCDLFIKKKYLYVSHYDVNMTKMVKNKS